MPPPGLATGRCLCGGVRFRVTGPLRDVIFCHCSECRRWNGHFSANTAVARADLELLADADLRWFDSPESDAHARRGFCARCGSSLFWDAPAQATISIAAGTLDQPSGLRAGEHWHVGGSGDYYDVPGDGLPRFDGAS